MTNIKEIIGFLKEKIINKKPRTDYDAGFKDGFEHAISLIENNFDDEGASENKEDSTPTREVAINNCQGGVFLITNAQRIRYNQLAREYNAPQLRNSHEVPWVKRDDWILIKSIKDFPCDDISIVEIPGDIEWTIEEYDGIEWVEEKHRTWGADDD